ncbi:DNA-binding protein RHL1 isoform X1 [Cryptomeria japonica]|uniref:DNA-binding protein RHL1 isoform X1 n=1 Tax=Cryptomeria japonica TaxID=3369 RepID=UPI0027D9EB25|nr:DNA-binding protein RHL1 isoform X1 [Cryptomeria japonica]
MVKAAKNGVAENAEDLERQRLRKMAFSRKIISQVRANPSRPLQPSKSIIKSDGRDIVKKGQRKSKYLFAFPCLIAPVSGGKMGELSHLDTKNPILYVSFPQGRLKFFGTIMYPKNKYISLHFPKGAGDIVCEDSFDSLVVFSDVWWIGTEEENPEELQLDFPKELNQEKHAEFDFKGGAGCVSDHKDISAKQLPLKECVEQLTHDTDSDSESLRDCSDKSTINIVREESKTPVQEESKTPVRTSSRRAGKTYKFVESPSEDELESTGSDSGSSDIEVKHTEKKQEVNRNLFNVHEEAAVGDSVPILADLGNDENKKASTMDAQNASSSAPKTSTRKKSKESVNKSPTLATTKGLVQSSLSSFLLKPEEKKSQSEKAPVTKGPVQKRQQPTDSKGKSKKKKSPEENLSQEEIVQEVNTTPRQVGRRISGRGGSGSKAKQSKKKQESSDEEEVPSESEESDESDEDWKA